MPEQQNIEYKQSWHDNYLKWGCGFENALIIKNQFQKHDILSEYRHITK